MKKSIVLAIVGLTISAAPSFGQGMILLDNYDTYGPYVTYAPGSGALTGQGLHSNFTAGLYYALGDITGSVAPDPTGMADPTSLGAFTLGAGTGSTAAFESSTFGVAGTFRANLGFGVPGTADAGGDTITLMIVAYDGSSYDTALHRGHSDAFTMVTAAPSNPSYPMVGDYMSGFTVLVPEPTTMALGGLGLAALLLVRRKKA